ncbi:MAG: IclR family transcriptional regulator [Deltaproteobacteria bacterium]|nr:IclR family transcriptional regulator [Candidatus Anaeroferrophillus wilburensis]MBN2889481.1 IclR family transcriptional regulator [Deltaproteobacteria bacterium]
MIKREKSNYTIQAVAHALSLLEEFSGDVDELGVTELSKRLKLHKNNVFRLLATLEEKGYIEQNRVTENYRLGIKSLELGQTFIKQMGVLRQAHPIMERLCEDLQENAYVGVIRGSNVVYLDVVESNQAVRVVSRVGSQLPVWCSAIGKAQIAYLNLGELDKILPSVKEWECCTENSVKNKDDLLLELEQVRVQGYAVDDEEYDLDVKCVGAPIRDYTKRVVAGISVSGPSFRLTEERIINDIAPAVKKSAADISRRLGYEVALSVSGEQ